MAFIRRQWLFCLALLISASPLLGQLTLYDTSTPIEGFADFLGLGLSFVDFNLDGYDDLTVPNSLGQLSFFAGGPNGFVNVDLGIVPASGRPTGIIWLDIDNDGDRDLLYSSSPVVDLSVGAEMPSKSEIWVNNEGVFENATDDWGWGVLENLYAAGLAISDFDLDGDLDVAVPSYGLDCMLMWESENFLFENENGMFLDISVDSGIADGISPSFQYVWIDLNDDDLVDLFLINDSGVQGQECMVPNQAYVNQGDGTFVELGEDLGLAVIMASMSATITDSDENGVEEIFITNQEDPLPGQFQTAAYFVRDSTNIYHEQSMSYGLDLNRWSWGALEIDLDLDGREDLMIATHHFAATLEDLLEYQFYDNYWMHHNGVDTVTGHVLYEEDLSDWPGKEAPLFCIVRGDIDCDGDPDVAGIGTNQYLTIWENETDVQFPENASLTVAVCGTYGNSEAIGTKMTLHTAGSRQHRHLRAGEDFLAQHSTTQFFGLGSEVEADSLEIFWPNGHRSVFYDLVADSAYRFVERSEEITFSIESIEGDSVIVQLSVPPKWTGISWNGVENDSLVWSGLIGADLSFEVDWFHGLFTVSEAVDWSSILNLEGCTNQVASNYDDLALIDNGSCVFDGFCGPGTIWSSELEVCVIDENTSCASDVNSDGVIGVADVLMVLSEYGDFCAE